jgi:hypothetical protein
MFHKAFQHITTDSIDFPIRGIQMYGAMRAIDVLSGPRTPRTQSVSAGCSLDRLWGGFCGVSSTSGDTSPIVIDRTIFQ